MAKKSGVESQLTGERAETKVRDSLLDAGMFCSKYEHDRGEDLLVELEGYVAPDDRSVQPRIGLLQIKGHKANSEGDSQEGTTKRRLQLEHLRRWAAIPLPVLVVAVEIHDRKPYFFSQSVDKIVIDVAPDGLGSLDQVDMTVQLPSVCDLPAFLTREIKSFYLAHAFQFAELSENVIARNHYEIISTHTPFVPTTAKVWMKNIRVLWKGPWRPAHFWATLNHIADTLQAREGGKHRPLDATIHVYRSLKDHRDNNAIAHVSWIEDTHPDTKVIRELINWPKAKHWSRFRFNDKLSIDDLPESYVNEEDDEVYLAKLKPLWLQMDEICEKIFSSIDAELRIPNDHIISLEERFRKLDDYLSDNLGQPSPQFRVMDQVIQQYAFTMSGVFTWLRGKKDVPEVRRKRWLQQDLEELQGYYRVFQVLYKTLNSC